MAARDARAKGSAALGIRWLGVGALVRVQSAAGEVWSANVTYVSDRLVGLRGWTPVEGTFSERDTVTLLIGFGERLVSANARVLAATGTLLRIVRRDGSDEIDRRRAPRLRVDLTATVTPTTGDAAGEEFDADVVDLSASGCAILGPTPLPVGTRVGLTMDLRGAPADLTGEVMRTWTGDMPPFAHAGIQFDFLTPAAARVVNRFLVTQLQSDLPVR